MTSDMKHYLLTLMALLTAMTLAAQDNRIFIDDFEIDRDSTVTVPVMLANVDPTRGIQFNLTLPQGLTLGDYEETPYSVKYKMSITCRHKTDQDYYMLLLVPSRPVCFPPDTARVINLTLAASSDFKGGTIDVWQCRGSTKDNHTIVMGGDAVQVTVPEASLIGIPIEQKPAEDQFFNKRD